jgi:hypothetical protein
MATRRASSSVRTFTTKATLFIDEAEREGGGHSVIAADPEAEFLARLGRRRILTLKLR